MDDTAVARPMRADARRNRDRLLAEARAAFLEHGVDASLEYIASGAGVGIGTLYRHFPTREDLLAALLQNQFDALTAEARRLLDREAAREALTAWAYAFAETSTVYRGLTAALMATIRDENSALHASCESMRQAGTTLLARAQKAGELRPDIDPTEFFLLIAGLAWAHEQSPGQPLDRLLAVLFEGLTPR
ncbi:TetR/AcrR family transcriptional regulator [Actinomadura sp. 6N118]|uniref:TetR/AcrR family transcriptional regulator n=1 Tax=Actinomadura sp. 6N118 TaxID=3375151 RepID=UPI00378F3339